MYETEAAIEGGYGYANLGDDVLMLAAVACLTRCFPASQISVPIVSGGEYISRWLPACHVVTRQQQHRTRHLLYGGGTLFFSFGAHNGTPWKRAARLGRLLRDPAKCVRRILHGPEKVLVPAFEARHHYAIGIGLGPFADDDKIRTAKRSIAACNFVAVRDPVSAALCQSWGMDHVVLGGDLCFASNLWTMGGTLPARVIDRVRTIGVVVRDWKHTAAGISMCRAIPEGVMLLTKAGFKVTYLLFQQDPRWRRRLENHRMPVLSYEPESQTPIEFCQALQDFDLIISTRAHGAMLAGLMGIPSICVEIEPKLQLVSEALGGTAVWAHPYDPVQLVKLVDSTAEDIRGRAETLGNAVARQRQMTEKSIEDLVRHLDSMASDSEGRCIHENR